jgi:hypothetical protein
MNSTMRLLTIAALFLVPAAWADILSSNLSSNVFFTELVSGNTWIGAGFATGSTTYTLGGATLLMRQNSPGSATLDLYSDLGGKPGSALGSLGTPSGFSPTLTATEFSGANLLLAANSTYWLVLRSDGGDYEWAYTDNNTGSGPGFIGTWGASDNAGGSWLVSDLDPMIMRVDASPANAAVPEPAEILLFGIGILTLAALLSHKNSHRKEAQVGL